jgi:hypothetical protein
MTGFSLRDAENVKHARACTPGPLTPVAHATYGCQLRQLRSGHSSECISHFVRSSFRGCPRQLQFSLERRAAGAERAGLSGPARGGFAGATGRLTTPAQLSICSD